MVTEALSSVYLAYVSVPVCGILSYRLVWIIDIEDLTRVVKLYEMTTSVRVCLSYDPFKWDFIAFNMGNISKKQTHC